MIDLPQLGLELYTWWHAKLRPETGSGVRIHPGTSVNLTREKNKVYLQFDTIEHVLGFEESKLKKAKADFFVFSPDTTENNIEPITEAISYVHTNHNRESSFTQSQFDAMVPLSSQGRKQFESIFGSYHNARLTLDQIQFEDRNYSGVHVRIPIRTLPLGTKGHLSDKLFVYTQKGILAPVHAAIKLSKLSST